MWFKTLLLAAVLAICMPTFAATESGIQTESPLAQIEWRDVEKILTKHFSIEDIASLKEYMKGAMLGLEMPMPPDLKGKVRDFMTEMRLEYGFQFAVLMEQLKKKIFRVLPPDLAELAEEFTQKSEKELEQ